MKPMRIYMLWSLCTFVTAYLSREERQAKHPDIFHFPYMGRGDPDHTFRHPYEPGPGGDPVNSWFQLGSTVVSRSQSGRDTVRLTSASRENQGLFHNAVPTESQNFNGYIDIQMDSSDESHEPADGMGFFFVRDPPKLGSAMGLSHNFHGLALIIDTFSNSRTRSVPYLYAYVSDGTKPWNAELDGSDTELAKGCSLDMNNPTRVYVQFVDGTLHVGVAMNSHTPNRWHTCFKVSNVRLPFTGGGYFAFAGETGHFFAVHQVHDAVFIDESPHSGEDYHSDYHSQQYDSGSVHQHETTRNTETHESSSQHDTTGSSTKPGEPSHHTNPDPTSRVYRGADGKSSLSGSLDLQVYEVYNSMSSMLKGLGDHEADDTKVRLEGVRDITSHLIQEMEKQKEELGNLVNVLRHFRGTSGDLIYSSDHFKSQLQGLRNSLRSLKEKTQSISESHDELHQDITSHHATIGERAPGNGGTVVMFLMIQCLLAAGVYLVNKITLNSRKVGRMV